MDTDVSELVSCCSERGFFFFWKNKKGIIGHGRADAGEAPSRCEPESGSEIIIAGSGKGSVCADAALMESWIKDGCNAARWN